MIDELNYEIIDNMDVKMLTNIVAGLHYVTKYSQLANCLLI